MNKEVWKDIKGYEGFYQISNIGRVKSLVGWNRHRYIQRELILKQTMSTTGYLKVELKKDGKRKSIKVHRLVASAFLDNPEGKKTVNHKDGNKTNNEVSNLEWNTHSENINHAFETGLSHRTEISKELLENLYVEKRLSTVAISKLTDTTPTIVSDNMRRYGIQIRTRKEAMNKYRIDENELHKDFENGLKNKALAQKYHCTTDVIRKRRELYNRTKKERTQ